MKICSFSELKCKEVINVCDGKRLGYVSNAEFEIPCGQIVSISVPAENRCFSFGKCEELKIPWCNIERIGEDTVLVKADFLSPAKR